MADTTIDFVMGKGGVGRSTVSRLLAHHYSSRGESTIIVECNGCANIPACYDKQSQGYTATPLTKDIDIISVSPMAAIEDYVVQQLKMRKLYELIFDNRLVKPLIEAAPGFTRCGSTREDLRSTDQWTVGSHRGRLSSDRTRYLTDLCRQTMMDVSRRGPLYKQGKAGGRHHQCTWPGDFGHTP